MLLVNKLVRLNERKRVKRTSCCCDYIATPRKSPISCDPEAKLGWCN
ncbi:TPA: hypothetical protein HA338_12215 [Methanosarcina acetivorans]|uniref:Uncharacterized protein n=1 Tax=Methanosarcina acetivorans TaxID=2214 RepID=A0A832WAG6_9EURY|nr:hypothetical protein [Methanosarcina acetivorans]HIH94746.1 hypothetical protein [Methanosarcina acetivorans]